MWDLATNLGRRLCHFFIELPLKVNTLLSVIARRCLFPYLRTVLIFVMLSMLAALSILKLSFSLRTRSRTIFIFALELECSFKEFFFVLEPFLDFCWAWFSIFESSTRAKCTSTTELPRLVGNVLIHPPLAVATSPMTLRSLKMRIFPIYDWSISISSSPIFLLSMLLLLFFLSIFWSVDFFGIIAP